MKKFVWATLAIVACTLFTASAAGAVVHITKDYGGRIVNYVDKYNELHVTKERVVIDGLCASACTIVLGSVASSEQICVTKRAKLGFHAAWDEVAKADGTKGTKTNKDATEMLFMMYPPHIQRWINQRGGLKSKMIFLSGRTLTSMYRPCGKNSQADSRI